MNNLKSYIEYYINRLVYEEGEAVGGAVVGTPANTLGMGNPMTPTDTQPGSEPIVTAKSRKEKKIKSKTKKLKESLLDDEDVLVSNHDGERNYITNTVLNAITKYRNNYNNYSKTRDYLNSSLISCDYDHGKKLLEINIKEPYTKTLFIQQKDFWELAENSGFSINQLKTNISISFIGNDGDSTNDNSVIDGVNVQCENLWFHGVKSISNFTYTQNPSSSSYTSNWFNICDEKDTNIKLNNFKYIPTNGIYHTHNKNMLCIRSLKNIQWDKPIQGINQLVIYDDSPKDKDSFTNILDKMYVKDSASFTHTSTNKEVSVNNMKKYLQYVRQSKAYLPKDRGTFNGTDIRKVLKLPDLKLVVICNQSLSFSIWINNDNEINIYKHT